MDTVVWVLISTALVLLMTPGLAFFYGGLVKEKSVVSMMMMSFGSLGLVAVLWILIGANMSSIDGSIWSFSGNPFSNFGQEGVAGSDLLVVAFGGTFAIITTALISGAIADRARFGPWMIYTGVWATLVYFPVAAWVWGGGWIQNLGDSLGGLPAVIDYAGGTAVHINAGAAALGLALVLGKRVGFNKEITQPHNVPLVLIGAALLWFGWFGFNAGAASDADEAGLIVFNTLAAPAAGILGWIVVEKLRTGKATAVGAVSGVVAGLVAITPACANLTPGWTLVLGAIAGAVSALAIELKYNLGFDDSLDVVGLHLVAGIIGTIYLGFFATGTGLFTGGDAGQLVVQTISVLAVAIFSFVMSWLIGTAIQKTIGFRVTSEEEIAGIDLAVHGESGYALSTRETVSAK
ncbi:ammonium transporter [Salinibacterium sp. M195]|uniref:ammonium transporter n=1 Tax=Salinibacterium sp. M195 TaxID=2583374 RepID=UPI001C6310F7|nr:ammonium transporter [Salinibacterium sp. M195]QYH35570.1 ammonium transporter [Salinibacterium sp. M195]